MAEGGWLWRPGRGGCEGEVVNEERKGKRGRTVVYIFSKGKLPLVCDPINGGLDFVKPNR